MEWYNNKVATLLFSKVDGKVKFLVVKKNKKLSLPMKKFSKNVEGSIFELVENKLGLDIGQVDFYAHKSFYLPGANGVYIRCEVGIYTGRADLVSSGVWMTEKELLLSEKSGSEAIIILEHLSTMQKKGKEDGSFQKLFENIRY